MSTKLKLLGVDVASFGDAHAATRRRPRDRVGRPAHRRLQEARRRRRDGGRARRRAGRRRRRLRHRSCRWPGATCPRPEHPEALILPDLGLDHGGNGAALVGVGAMADAATICSCENVTKGAHLLGHRRRVPTTVGDLKAAHPGRHRLRRLRAAR